MILKINEFKTNILNYLNVNELFNTDINQKFLEFRKSCDKFDYSNYSSYVKDWVDPSDREIRQLNNGKVTKIKNISLQHEANKLLDDYRKVSNSLQEELSEYRSNVISEFLKVINGQVSIDLFNCIRSEIDKIYKIIECNDKNRPVNKFVFRVKSLKNIVPESNYAPHVETRERTKKAGIIFKSNMDYIEEKITSDEIQNFCKRSKMYLSKLIEDVKNEISSIIAKQIKESINEYINQELDYTCKILEAKKQEINIELEKYKKLKKFLQKYNLELDKVLNLTNEISEEYLIQTAEENN